MQFYNNRIKKSGENSNNKYIDSWKGWMLRRQKTKYFN